MDIMARCVTQALLVSHAVRPDAEISLVLLGPPDPPKVLRFIGARVRSLNPDERGTAALIRKALSRPAGIREVETTPGVMLSRADFAEAVRRCDSPAYQLDEGGEDVGSLAAPADATFVLSDAQDLTDQEREILAGIEARRVRLGPVSLHADQCITVIHNWLDRALGAAPPL
jgi:tRNA (pseudouridine54-N1)-methyltransferase